MKEEKKFKKDIDWDRIGFSVSYDIRQQNVLVVCFGVTWGSPSPQLVISEFINYSSPLHGNMLSYTEQGFWAF